jgi:hypothetical protein
MECVRCDSETNRTVETLIGPMPFCRKCSVEFNNARREMDRGKVIITTEEYEENRRRIRRVKRQL